MIHDGGASCHTCHLPSETITNTNRKENTESVFSSPSSVSWFTKELSREYNAVRLRLSLVPIDSDVMGRAADGDDVLVAVAIEIADCQVLDSHATGIDQRALP